MGRKGEAFDLDRVLRAERVVSEIHRMLGKGTVAISIQERFEEKSATWHGRFRPEVLLIEASMCASDPIGDAHQHAFRAAFDLLLTPEEISALDAAFYPGSDWMRRLEAAMIKDDQGSRLDGIRRDVADNNLDEAEALAFRYWMRGDMKPAQDSVVERLFAYVREAMERLSNFIKGSGFRSAEDVFEAIRDGQAAARAGAIPRDSELGAMLYRGVAGPSM